jgi:prepilin-type N-terminal cleavage/methylation domain-containing protein
MKRIRAATAMSPQGTPRGLRRFLAKPRNDNRGFTLFEVILAIALAAVLLTLIGTAINLYLVQVDAGRTRVEEAQLARSILSMFADDIRATTVYKPQDTSAIAQLMAKTAKFDVDDIDKAAAASGGVGKASAITSISGGVGSLSSAAALGGSGASGTPAGSTDDSDTDTTLPLGINGKIEELYVDATRLPKQEEIFGTTTGYTNAQSPNAQSGSTSGSSSTGVPASDLKTVHYFIRPGEAVDAGSASVTSLDPTAQARIGGLVRQEIPRAMRNFAEKNGGSNVLDSNAVLLAPEVVRMEVRFFDGSTTADNWDMKEKKSLPLAVEVCIWLRSPNATNEPIASTYDAATLAETTHEYRQVVYVPMAQVANAAQTSNSTDMSTTDSTNSTDPASAGNGSSGTGSAFGQE